MTKISVRFKSARNLGPFRLGMKLADGILQSDNDELIIGRVRASPTSMELVSEFGTSSVEPKVMSLLSVLLQEPGRVWSRSDLLDRVWGNADIGDENLTRTIYLLRKALRDPHGVDNVIKTVPKHGYQFRIIAQSPSRIERKTVPSDTSLAVLPFKNVLYNDDDEFLADGLCTDLTSLLSRVSALKVAPLSSAVSVSRDIRDPLGPSQDLNVRYLVVGSFQRVDRKVRIRVELLDSAAGGTVWSQKYDADLDEFFGLQNDIVRSIATTISSEVNIAGLKAVLDRPKFDLSVYELLQAAEAERWTYNRRAVRNIINHLNAALKIDPDNAQVHTALAVQLSQNLVNGWAEHDRLTTKTQAEYHLSRAQSIDPAHPEVLAAAGINHMMMGQCDLALPFLERSASLNPNDPHVRALLGLQRCVVNLDESQIDLILSAEKDAPHHPRFAIWANYRAICHLRLGSFEAAFAAYEQCAVRDPNYTLNLFSQSVPLMYMGRMQAATEQIEKGLRLEPSMTLSDFNAMPINFPFAVPIGTDIDDFVEMARIAWPKSLIQGGVD